MTSDHGADRDGRSGVAGSGAHGFGAVLRGHRQRAGLTQEELAGRAGIGVRTVRDLERGRVSRPQRTTVELLVRALGLTGPEHESFLAEARRPAAATASPRSVRLPAAIDLVGRESDVEELAVVLTAPPPEGARLVTLVGLAGVGKTALAHVLAHRVAAAHPGGVAGIVVTEGFTAGEILGAIAAVFTTGRADDLASRLAGTPAVVLIDAVERAPDAVAEALARLLDHVPTLRFVATGRHPVGLPAERVRPLTPLVAPPADVPPTLADVTAFPAAALFVERLARVRPVPLEPAEAAPLAALVRRLGGLPLAIELAAARGRVLTLTEILQRYGDRVLDLAGRSVSVRDAVAASYALLDPAEQYALRRLAMLRYRWSLALAEDMIDNDVDVVHLLDRLLELGLLGVRGDRAMRFRLLDVVRDFAAERAAAEGDLAAGRRRHAEVMADLAQRLAPELAGPRFADAATGLDGSADVARDPRG